MHMSERREMGTPPWVEAGSTEKAWKAKAKLEALLAELGPAPEAPPELFGELSPEEMEAAAAEKEKNPELAYLNANVEKLKSVGWFDQGDELSTRAPKEDELRASLKLGTPRSTKPGAGGRRDDLLYVSLEAMGYD